MLENGKGILTIIFYKIKTAMMLNYAKISPRLIVFPSLHIPFSFLLPFLASFFPSFFKLFYYGNFQTYSKAERIDQYNEWIHPLPVTTFINTWPIFFRVYLKPILSTHSISDYIMLSVNI